MAYNNQYGYQSPPPGAAQNLQFYPSSYSTGPVSGHTTPFQASTGYGSPPAGGAPAYGNYGGAPAAFGGQMGNVSGRMGEQMGLRTGWLAAFGTEGYENEPGLMQELGVNFGHIKTKVRQIKIHPLSPPSQLTNTRCAPDLRSPEPPLRPLASHHGRQRPVRRPPLPHPLRHLPRPLRQVLLRLHLRHRPLRQHRAALDLRAHDATPRPQRRPAGESRPSPRKPGRPLQLYADLQPQRERAGVLLPAAGDDESSRDCAADGQFAGVCGDEHGGGVVHVQFVRDVRERGQDEGHARAGGVSAGIVLCGLWHHGDLLE